MPYAHKGLASGLNLDHYSTTVCFPFFISLFLTCVRGLQNYAIYRSEGIWKIFMYQGFHVFLTFLKYIQNKGFLI